MTPISQSDIEAARTLRDALSAALDAVSAGMPAQLPEPPAVALTITPVQRASSDVQQAVAESAAARQAFEAETARSRAVVTILAIAREVGSAALPLIGGLL